MSSAGQRTKDGRPRIPTGRPRQAIDHGTPRGYQAHRRRGETACTSCKIAWRRLYQAYRRGNK